MKNCSKVFLLLGFGKYTEITYQELVHRREQIATYKDKLFIPIGDVLLEVTKEDYSDFYKNIEHHKYLKKLEKKNGLISLDALQNEELSGMDICADPNTDIARLVELRILNSNLRECLAMLSSDEVCLIYDYFYCQIPETELAKRYKVNQSTISRRIDRIIEKLKKLMKI